MDVALQPTLRRYPEIATIFETVFDHYGALSPATTPDDVAHWDSQRHIALVIMIETTYGISLSMDEMMEIRSVADIETILDRHGV
jgi:acyl carrier protein